MNNKRTLKNTTDNGPPAKIRTTTDLLNDLRRKAGLKIPPNTPSQQTNTHTPTLSTMASNTPTSSTTKALTNQTTTLPPSFFDCPFEEDEDASPIPPSGTVKQEQTTITEHQTTQPSKKQHNLQLKNAGRISVSLHGTDVYTDAEIWCILHTLRARKASRPGRNLVRAELLTGTYTHAEKTYEQFQMNEKITHEDIGSVIDQCTQVNEEDIAAAYPKEPPKPIELKPVPELIENNDIVPSGSKPADIIFNQRAFINYTKYAIPEDVAVILSMGPKFAVPVYNSDKDFEDLKGTAYTLNEIYGHVESKAEVRNNIDKYIREYRQNQRQYRTEQKDYFNQAIKATTQFIKQHPDIIAIQSDKARASILMDKQVYITKVENLLCDRTTYQPIKTSATRSYMKINENLLKRMAKLKIISDKEVSAASSRENQPANLYGLLKSHKADKPMRPIVNTRCSMGFLLAEKVTEILTTARDTGLRYNVLNSRMACDRIRDTSILPDEKLYSLDIVSMFTNITVDRAIHSVTKRQKEIRADNEIIKLIIDVIKFVCIQSTEIRFNDQIYKQIKGLRMGSSLSPILADFVVEDMLDNAFTTIERPRLLMKYVDDLLCILETDEAERFFNALNNCDPNIKFELETENEGKINYLDVTVYRDKGTLKTIWYQKHISSGLFLNYHSNHPRTTIWNTAIQYVVTMILNTHIDHYDTIIKTARERLHRNSFPSNVAQQIIDAAKKKIIGKNTNIHDTTAQDKKESIHYTRSIEYIPKLTEKIQREIIDSHKKNGEEKNMQIPATPMHTMNKKIYNRHKNSNSEFDITEHTADISIDLTQPNTSSTNN